MGPEFLLTCLLSLKKLGYLQNSFSYFRVMSYDVYAARNGAYMMPNADIPQKQVLVIA